MYHPHPESVRGRIADRIQARREIPAGTQRAGAGATAPRKYMDGAQGMAQAGESEFGFLADDTRAIALGMADRKSVV